VHKTPIWTNFEIEGPYWAAWRWKL